MVLCKSVVGLLISWTIFLCLGYMHEHNDGDELKEPGAAKVIAGYGVACLEFVC